MREAACERSSVREKQCEREAETGVSEKRCERLSVREKQSEREAV